MNILQCWSGGKDSSLSAYLHLERGDNVTLVCCLPYFDDEIPLISKSQIQFIFDKANFFRSLGANVVILRGMTYYDYCTLVFPVTSVTVLDIVLLLIRSMYLQKVRCTASVAR